MASSSSLVRTSSGSHAPRYGSPDLLFPMDDEETGTGSYFTHPQCCAVETTPRLYGCTTTNSKKSFKREYGIEDNRHSARAFRTGPQVADPQPCEVSPLTRQPDIDGAIDSKNNSLGHNLACSDVTEEGFDPGNMRPRTIADVVNLSPSVSVDNLGMSIFQARSKSVDDARGDRASGAQAASIPRAERSSTADLESLSTVLYENPRS